MRVFTLLHPLSAERSVLNGKLLLLRRTDEDPDNPDIGYRMTFIDGATRKPLFVTTPLVKPLVQDEDQSYWFETESGIIYRLIDVLELIPTAASPTIEVEDLIISQRDTKQRFIGKNEYDEHRFVFTRPITREEFVQMCTSRGYKMKMEFAWHEDHTEIEANNDDLTDWSYRWIRVFVN